MLQVPGVQILLGQADAFDLVWSATTLDQNMMPVQLVETNACSVKATGAVQLRLMLGTLTVTFDGQVFEADPTQFPGQIHVRWRTNDQSPGRTFGGHTVTYTGGEFTTVVTEAAGAIQSCGEDRVLRFELETVPSRARALRIDTDVSQSGHQIILVQHLTDITVSGKVSFTPRDTHLTGITIPSTLCQTYEDSSLPGVVSLATTALEDVPVNLSATLDTNTALTVNPPLAIVGTAKSSTTFSVDLPAGTAGRVVVIATSGAEQVVATCEIAQIDADLAGIEPSNLPSTATQWSKWMKHGYCVSHSPYYEFAVIPWFEWVEIGPLEEVSGRPEVITSMPRVLALNGYGYAAGSVQGLPAVWSVQTNSWHAISAEAGEVAAISDGGWIGVNLANGNAELGRLTDDGISERVTVKECVLTSVNGRGDAVGYRYSDGCLHGIFFAEGREVLEPNVVWKAVGDDGQAVGVRRNSEGTNSPVAMVDGELCPLGTKPGGALAVNGKGMAVGFVEHEDGRHPAAWFPDGDIVVLDDGCAGWSGRANAVNQHGRVVGTMERQDGTTPAEGFDFTTEGALGRIGTRLVDPGFARIASANMITDSGLVLVEAYFGRAKGAAVLKAVRHV